MIKKVVKISSVLVIVSMLLAPVMASAAPLIPKEKPEGFAEKFFGCGDGASVTCIIGAIVKFLLAIVFIVALVFLVIGGFRYIVSQGNEEGVEKAKGTITNAIIGIVVVLLSWIILTAIVKSLEQGPAV
ncbi:MAG: hypothetical protein COT91_04335 [Candidatus Doudnabacteria bacterium CG10_big_fil_rev_8_21_14_0_10_41_10]|uniref:DUF4190 domain-containing protein n=1 Tax=Candidatus Doudnabacteria bacterium CG10_big_fil_rev_8_21_14_0_10_41_10 TaxID=1974551 RepID=A0A2H0VCN8_9BACT|nr:MAG: hypothetical protein COT91_04335 [Candidatus Doudnabacteria bacterium CG10_big_fil_rev_8_21_14_0_10_41_10]